MAAPKGNKYALGLTNSGRPPIYENPEELEKRIVEYFDYIQGERGTKMVVGKDGVKEKEWKRPAEPATITGLALFLGFSTKTTLYEYAKREEFANSMKRALTLVEQQYEKNLNSSAVAGSIFALKNFGWKDTQHNVNSTIEVEIPEE